VAQDICFPSDLLGVLMHYTLLSMFFLNVANVKLLMGITVLDRFEYNTTVTFPNLEPYYSVSKRPVRESP